MALCMVLAVFGLIFGLYLIAEAIWWFGLVRLVRPAPVTEVRVSCAVIGIIFIVLAILTLTGVIPCPP